MTQVRGRAGNGSVPGISLACLLGLSAPTLNVHLKTLRAAEVVSAATSASAPSAGAKAGPVDHGCRSATLPLLTGKAARQRVGYWRKSM